MKYSNKEIIKRIEEANKNPGMQHIRLKKVNPKVQIQTDTELKATLDKIRHLKKCGKKQNPNLPKTFQKAAIIRINGLIRELENNVKLYREAISHTK